MKLNKIHKLTTWQVGLIKLIAMSFGVLAGLYFRNFFIDFVPVLIALIIFPAIYIVYIWFK